MTVDEGTNAALRRIPKVDDLLSDQALETATAGVSRKVLVEAVRDELGAVRAGIRSAPPSGPETAVPSRAELVDRIAARARAEATPRLRRVINATGIIVHTNLGRAILPREAVARLVEAAVSCTNLEFDLVAGERGSRHEHLRALLQGLTGAEDALVVNNNAAAVLLVLNTLARGREAIVSRGELVEIGGSFRIPDVMSRSGAVLREVGTTNRTHLRDYEEAVTPQTALFLKVHTSNYRVIGFTHSVGVPDLSALGSRLGIPVVEDLGSGSLLDLSAYGLDGEPTVAQSVAAGADLVTFSGDKLLGGPQAGIIVGDRKLISLVDRNPLHRALRIDKFTVAALEATLRLYRDGESPAKRVPVLAMISAALPTLRRAASRLAGKIGAAAPPHLTVAVTRTVSRVGGGALPLRDLPSAAVALSSTDLSPNDLERHFRGRRVPVIGRIEDGVFLLDVRTILSGDTPAVIDAVREIPA
jgi:L-seryl-tRNA(Ser) seleniumtransferase